MKNWNLKSASSSFGTPEYKKNIYFPFPLFYISFDLWRSRNAVYFSSATQFVMLTTMCLREEDICGVLRPLLRVRYDQASEALKIFMDQEISEGR